MVLVLTAMLALGSGRARASDESLRLIDPSAVRSLVASANRIEVVEILSEGERVLYSSHRKDDIAQFVDALDLVRPETWFHCGCLGNPAIRLFSGSRLVASVSNHHGLLVRVSGWDGDATLANQEKWLQWFDRRGISSVRQEVDDAKQRAEQNRAAEARWVSAMPRLLQPLWQADRDRIVTTPAEPDLDVWQAALVQEYPDFTARIASLLHWYGSGAGPWSGYPSYEGIAEDLLLLYSTPELLSAVEALELTPEQSEGAARLFGGWQFRSSRPSDGDLLSENLRRTLLVHAMASSDEDKRARASAAFEIGAGRPTRR
jgi:hypothetical protein